MLLEASGIVKSFGPTVALSRGSVTLRSGEIHALVGENGAGKSTLFKVIAGHERGDSGTVTIDGERFSPATPLEAARRGVAMVMQELTISHALGVAENVFIDRLRDFTTRWGSIDRKKLSAAARAILEEIGSDISVEDDLAALELGQLKILEVARALSYRPRVLLLDESTAFLNTTEIDELLRVMRILKSQGLVVGFVSHHLDEVQKVADRVTVLKDGAFVGEYATAEIDRSRLEALMVGREAVFEFASSAPAPSAEPILELSGVRFQGMPPGVHLDLVLHRTEILGLGGLQGSGGQALLEGIMGERGAVDGTMALAGRSFAPVDAHDAWKVGIAYLPGDRTGEGLIPDFTIQENVVMTSYPRIGPFIDLARAHDAVGEAMVRFRIKAEEPSVRCAQLSGGNMQKTLLAKCLFARPRILLLNNPTRGVDVASRFEIYQLLRELVREQGLSIIMLTEDLIELIGLSDRILVMNKGHIRAELRREDAPVESDVISHMV